MKVDPENVSKSQQQNDEQSDADVEPFSNHSRQSAESTDDAENIEPGSKNEPILCENKPSDPSVKKSKDKLSPSFRSIDFVTENVPVVNEHLKLLKRIGEVPFKVVASIVLRRIQSLLLSKHRPEHAGFTTKRSTADWILALRVLAPQRKEYRQGTFATVYLAESRVNPRFRFALKALVPTVHSSRIENEIRILALVGGQQNVIRLLSAIRFKDLVYLLMPYLQHELFADYFLKMTVPEIKDYMRNLMISLRHIHHFGVIHRDVKPSNFLYNRAQQTYMLVDFGLAHMEKNKRRVSDIQAARSGSRDTFPPKQRMRFHAHHSLSLGTSANYHPDFYKHRVSCRCGDRLTTCRACAALPAMGQGAQRGGTCGYRAPEVVLRYLDQTVAIDVWSAGMIFASFMAGRCPPLFSSSDNDYLHKMVYLCGYERMQAACWQIGRRLLVDPAPALDVNVSYSERLSQRLASIRARTLKMMKQEAASNDVPQLLPPPPPPPLLPPPSPIEEQSENSPEVVAMETNPLEPQFPTEAYDLLARMLDPNPTTRISAREALRHPFLAPSAPTLVKQ